MLHTLSWVVVNAREAAAEARFEKLLQTCPLSRYARSYGWETLGTHPMTIKRINELRRYAASPQYQRLYARLYNNAPLA